MVLALADPPIADLEPNDDVFAMRVLVVEDDPFTLTILNKRLVKGGYTVETATNGREALDCVARFKPHLILSDWMMPEMDGVELCTRVRELPDGPSVYFILLTAKDKNDDKVSALDTGADEYLVKPCDSAELMARLRAAERILRLRQQLASRNRELRQAMRRINQELQATSQIQRSLLPQELPTVEGYHFAVHYQPSTECSGDFYDLIPRPDGRLSVVIGDVSGHGTPAMVAMAMMHLLLQVEAPAAEDPARLLHLINNRMFQSLPTGQYCTMFFGILDPKTGELAYSSAGHNAPLHVCPGERTARFLPDCEGFPIKLVAPDLSYETHHHQLAPGQSLVLYTDGLPEAFNRGDEAYGYDRLRDVVETLGHNDPELIMDAMLMDMHLFAGDRPLDDDLSLLILSRE